jgi:hypothetical protein
MTTHSTQIYVAHQDAASLVVVSPPYSSLAAIFLGTGIVCWVAGILLTFVLRGKAIVPRGSLWNAFPLLLAVVIGTPFLFVGFHTARTTYVTVSADKGVLQVRQTLLSMPLSLRAYSLTDVQKAVLGVGEGCASLRLLKNDGASVQLIGCTDRSGYNEAAEAINRFLETHRSGS